MKTAFLFPGQASQYVGMGKDLVERHVRARELFERANDIMGTDLMRICFEGPAEELTQTRYTQPAIFVHSVAVAELSGVTPDMAAGHSLGEYSALVVAGALSFDDGLRLVKKRGELMQEAGTRSPGTMAAVIGAEPALVDEVCAEAAASGIVQAANFNSPGQIVISGSVSGVDAAMELLKARGVRIVKKLPVSGAFHSPLMQYAQDELGAVLEQTPINDARFPVYSNVTAEAERDATTIRANLLAQVTSPVLWENSMRNMIRDGLSRAIEMGPGNVLQGLLKRIDGNVTCATVGTADELAALD
ncbi:MAG TPA: ACP S-malonyltransferase [Bacteroidota bacterium]|nr:ACP S-malonyltransferase [Bacteroidota bacterium]